MCYIREIEDLQALKVEFLKHQKNLHIFAADLSNRIEVDDLCDNVTKTVGNIDVLINNAGILILEPLSECSEELLRVSFEVNVFAPFALTRHFSKAMIEKNGFNHKRVFFKFIYWWRRTKTLHLFCNKHALLGFSRALDEELRSKNIRVGTVSPAGVATDMMVGRDDLDHSSFMSADEVADAVMFMLENVGEGIVYEMRMWRKSR